MYEMVSRPKCTAEERNTQSKLTLLNVCCFGNAYLEHEDVCPRPALTHGSPNICFLKILKQLIIGINHIYTKVNGLFGLFRKEFTKMRSTHTNLSNLVSGWIGLKSQTSGSSERR
jgi:hypothetical protein